MPGIVIGSAEVDIGRRRFERTVSATVKSRPIRPFALGSCQSKGLRERLGDVEAAKVGLMHRARAQRLLHGVEGRDVLELPVKGAAAREARRQKREEIPTELEIARVAVLTGVVIGFLPAKTDRLFNLQ